jgi:dTDP-4-dehydrorhamnose 3,5-epimerase
MKIPGVTEIPTGQFKDHRGTFVKLPADFDTGEEFYTISGHHVLRGLHFQLPPAAVAKLVCCVWGSVMDVVLDLRRGSPAFGCHEARVLDSDNPKMVMIPPGVAHGFCVLGNRALMLYKQNGVYSREHDAGIRWDSAWINWPYNPIISNRDNDFPHMDDFESPFVYEG